MNSFDFFVQGNFRKIALEQGLDRKYLYFNLSYVIYLPFLLFV